MFNIFAAYVLDVAALQNCFLVHKTCDKLFIYQNSTVFVLLFQPASVMLLFSITLDRFIAIRNPLHHLEIMTTKVFIVMSVIIWTTAISLGGILPFLWHNGKDVIRTCDFITLLTYEYWNYIAAAAFYVLALLIILMYISILITTCKSLQVYSDNYTTSSKFRREVQATKTCAIVVGVFLLNWCPMLFIVNIQLINDMTLDPLLIVLGNYVSVLAILNSGVNPIIYAFHMPKLRTECLKLINCEKQNSSPQISMSSSRSNS